MAASLNTKHTNELVSIHPSTTRRGATEPVLARYGGSFPVGDHNLEVVLPASTCPMLFSPALFFYNFGAFATCVAPCVSCV